MVGVNNPRRANGHRRNQLMARVKARDTHCWLCHERVDLSIKTPHPLSAEVHEIIPVSRGGSALDLINCTITHRRCNQWIGNRTPAELGRDTRPKPTVVRASFNW